MKTLRSYIVILFGVLISLPLYAQWEKTSSVLKDHSWYKIGVVQDGVYGLDGTALQSLGVDLHGVDPSHIRLFGNVQGMLPESNAASRYDDLTEMAVMVTGAEDGSFDNDDRILFYGQGPVNWNWSASGYFEYERNSYSDTVFYFLCLDGSRPGMRISENPIVNTSEDDTVITHFPDAICHEKEEMSPYASGRTWYGDMFTSAEGSKDFVFNIPDLDQSQVIRVISRVLGRCSSHFTYNLKVNDNVLVDHVDIANASNLTYGHEHEINKMCFVDSDHITVRYELNPAEGNPLFYIDFFVINCWRELFFRNEELAFRLVPSQMVTPTSSVHLRGVNSSVQCWDVTDPLHPYRQPLEHQSGFSSFGVENSMERRYHLFESSFVKPVASCRQIPNQNLHGITDAEMLIITPRVFWEQATALADFHRDDDGMECVLADVQEIYNEFGTGMADPTSVRDFIRMVYLRSEGKLRYVLLMGKGTHDYRDIKGFGNNYVPTYQVAEKPWYEVSSICSDDYFALMDSMEGDNCTGYVDLGVGRFPITTPEQGDALLLKVKHYADLSATHGSWKNNHLFLVDNDARSYMDYAEDLDKILDTAWHSVTTKKLYTDSYPVVSTPSGNRVPRAHDDLMDYFKNGVGVMSYTGHGGVKGLMEELILTNSDVLAMDNFDNMPFVHTATCEFSKFDNPNLVSAGELMFLNPHGGAIAMLTTVRPTMGPNNQKVSRSFHEHLYDRQQGLPLRFGDIVRITKSDAKYYSKSNIGFVLFGDPALRINTPVNNVFISKINESDPLGTHVFSAGSLLTIEGYVAPPRGKIDTLFNGVMEVCLYDKKTIYTTLGAYTNPRDYSFYNDILFQGKVTVEKGRFSMQLPVPSDVNHCTGNARLCCYAYDSIRQIDANGVYDHLVLTDLDPMAVLDQKGPDIHLYWNTPDFKSGDLVNRNGILYADLFDEQGIYHYNVSIGRDVVLNSSLEEYHDLIMNKWFEPAKDDYRSGRIAFPVRELEDGTYTFSLKAWDTQNNSSEVEITLMIQEGIMLAEVQNSPNPFTGETRFSFIHGDKTEDLSVRIEIFDMMGRRVAELQQHTTAVAGVVPPIVWDGRGSHGQQLQVGVYVYRLAVTDSEGKTLTVSKRLIIG